MDIKKPKDMKDSTWELINHFYGHIYTTSPDIPETARLTGMTEEQVREFYIMHLITTETRLLGAMELIQYVEFPEIEQALIKSREEGVLEHTVYVYPSTDPNFMNKFFMAPGLPQRLRYIKNEPEYTNQLD